MDQSPYSLVVFGATSFVGRLTCRYLAERYGDGSLNWAMAGRSRTKLDALKRELGIDVPLILADAHEPDTLEALCGQTRVVVSTVGPYALYGEPLVAACAASGTDYCDLTGETHWIRRMITKYEDVARASGARIVHCCGFDSLPSDLGVYFLQAQAREHLGAPCTRVKMRVRAMKGGFSGGTVASMIQLARELRANPGLRKEMADPYSICPPGYKPEVRQPSTNRPAFDADAQSWIAPFIMASTNTRVVQRTNALSGQAYGADFRYDEAVLVGRGVKGRLRAYGLVAGLGGFLAGIALAPSRALLERFVLPGPGEGPSPQAQTRGHFDLRFFGSTADGQRIRCQVTGDRDPGYGSTCKMLGEAAVCLARDIDAGGGGFPTPATLFGQALIDRLIAHAGLTFERLD